MFIIKFCSWLYSNCGLLVLEATTQPTEPQPLPNFYVSIAPFIEICIEENVRPQQCALRVLVPSYPNCTYVRKIKDNVFRDFNFMWCPWKWSWPSHRKISNRKTLKNFWLIDDHTQSCTIICPNDICPNDIKLLHILPKWHLL